MTAVPTLAAVAVWAAYSGAGPSTIWDDDRKAGPLPEPLGLMFPAAHAVRRSGIATIVGLAAAVVPFAVVVHLIAEGMSLGADELGPAFVLRHLYLGALFVATAAWSARTLGLGFGAAERRRRCALIGAQWCGPAARGRGASLALANFAFFSLTQLVEGVPIASGDWCTGLAAGVAGSLLCALFVRLFGRSLIVAALGAIAILSGRPATPRPLAIAPGRAAARCASAAFSLFIPNRPPPSPFLA